VRPAVSSCKVRLDVFQIVASLVKRRAFGDRRATRGHVGFDESLYGSVKRPDRPEEVEACSLQLDNETGNVARRVGEGIIVQVESDRALSFEDDVMDAEVAVAGANDTHRAETSQALSPFNKTAKITPIDATLARNLI